MRDGKKWYDKSKEIVEEKKKVKDVRGENLQNWWVGIVLSVFAIVFGVLGTMAAGIPGELVAAMVYFVFGISLFFVVVPAGWFWNVTDAHEEDVEN
jgi:predicted membrane channel-forming protein YqfA (hemolysin III family)